MSNCPTGVISTTGSLTNSPFPAEDDARAPAVVACGALGPSLSEIARRRHWRVEIHLLPALLHNRPRSIAARADRLIASLQAAGHRVVLAYADCGTYGALDAVCERRGVTRLSGLHCYDVFAGSERIERLFADEPGTYLLTDFLVQSFRRTVLVELGLDRHPELWPDYFAHYRRVVWLAQRRSAELENDAREVARLFALPLEVVDVGVGALEAEFERLLFTRDSSLPRATRTATATAHGAPHSPAPSRARSPRA